MHEHAARVLQIITGIARLTFLVPAVVAAVASRERDVDLRTALKQRLSGGDITRLRCLARGKRLPRWGNLRVTEPFSAQWGIDRGTPVDRFYNDRFFEQHKEWITGRVLEIQYPVYTTRYGSNVSEAHSLDVDADVSPTILCDLARAEHVIPSNAYDCFLLPYTLPFVRDVGPALENALRIVRPGGVILASAAAMGPEFSAYPEYWRMTAAGWRELLDRYWPGCKFQVNQHGNCLSALASVLGLAQEELSSDELQVSDSCYPVLVTIFGQKPLHSDG